ncbi:MAG: SPOR domain-containing protein [Candidatus Zixiibacteriota bacterium]|nr:MAG: SPOR domain-containing protein [candidate division Zixibacteria bacterium]
MRTRGLWICLLFFFLVSTDCGFRPLKTPEEDRRTEAEGEFDPLGFPHDRVIVTQEEPPGRSEKVAESDKDNDITMEESPGAEEVLSAKVHRVQFFATKYPDEAKQVAESVAEQLSEQTYIEYKAPYYWVRVGDCETEREASFLLRKIKGLGYSQSWVVEVEIEP